jgi:hypothetical protein
MNDALIKQNASFCRTNDAFHEQNAAFLEPSPLFVNRTTTAADANVPFRAGAPEMSGPPRPTASALRVATGYAAKVVHAYRAFAGRPRWPATQYPA